ncbi:MAG: hypothetical protein JW959_09205 [Pirellulales bacterium]|nr:hypothetical protein [Pirellulales bacterium]
MPKPVLQALVLADHVYQDKITGKKIIAGTFNRVCFAKMKRSQAAGESLPGEQPPPSPFESTSETAMPGAVSSPPPSSRRLTAADVQKAGSPYAFISLTDVHGPTPLEMRYRDLSSEAILLGISFQVNSEDPLDTVEAVVPVPPLPTPHAGVFALELLAEGELLGALRITAVDTSEK